MERYVAIDDVCAWPNLTLMPDGAIVATIFNQPTSGRGRSCVQMGRVESGWPKHLLFSREALRGILI